MRVRQAANRSFVRLNALRKGDASMTINVLGLRLRAGLLGLVSLLVFCVAGCGDDAAVTGRVKGKVAFEGQPVTEGVVNFFNKADGTGAQAPLDSAGNFVLDAPIPSGNYVVYITPPRAPDPIAGQTAPAPKEYSNIPEKYRSENNTLLTAEIEGGENEVSFEMKR